MQLKLNGAAISQNEVVLFIQNSTPKDLNVKTIKPHKIPVRVLITAYLL